MQEPHYLDPFGSRLPALERNILKFRALQMLLVVFHAEEMKRELVGNVRATDEWRSSFSRGSGAERTPQRVTGNLKKALDALQSDGVLTPGERAELVGLIDFRNAIAHNVHHLFSDLCSDVDMRDLVLNEENILRYDYRAVDRLRYYRKLISKRMSEKRYVFSIGYSGIMFKSTERVLLGELERLGRRIDRMFALRKQEIAALNNELSLDGTGLVGDLHPKHPLNRYENGRLTQRGIEICYRLFDAGRSVMAVAHLTGLSLNASRRRKKLWLVAGGANRQRVDVESIPVRKFC